MNQLEVPAADRLVDDLLSLWRVLRQISQAERQVTLEQFWLLRTLDRCGPVSVGELADLLGIMSSSVTTACKRLERDGLVRRERQRGDERVVQVSLTDQGAAHVEHWRQARRTALARLLSPLGESEQAELQRLVERVLSAAAGGGATS